MNLSGKDKIPVSLLLSIFILSAVALAYEVLMVRIFSIIHWHHFAFMVISVALLGYGFSGSFVTVFRQELLKQYSNSCLINILLFGISSVVCFITVQQFSFNTLEILWDQSQWLQLLLSYVLLTMPFFFVANVITLTMLRFHSYIPMIYGADLVGAGVGAVSVMGLLVTLSPDTVLRMLAITALAAGLLVAVMVRVNKKQYYLILVLGTIVTVCFVPAKWTDLQISSYKGVEQALLVKDASLQARYTSPVAQIDVVQSPSIPFRHAAGLSLRSPVTAPQQLAVFKDGDEMMAIDYATDKDAIEYYDYQSSALAFHVHSSPKNVLVLRAGTGSRILQASLYDVDHIDAVEPERQLSSLFVERFTKDGWWSLIKDKVVVHTVSPRGYASSGKRYDLVVMGPPGASAGGAAGVYELSASYDFTVEAVQSYLEMLSPGGMLSITLWAGIPERSNLKLFTTAITAIRRSGVSKPEDNIAWIRSWNTATLLIKKSPLSPGEINRTRAFSESRGFDLAWVPGVSIDEVNRYQVLEKPVFYLLAESVLKMKDDNFVSNYKYNINPSTDDRPYFDNFFKWVGLAEFLSLPGKTGMSFLGVGYPTLLITFVQGVLVSILLILLPLLFLKKHKTKHHVRRRKIILYYMSIGLAFLFVEIAYIQKFTLIIGQPLYAVTVALCAFLIFSGVGSLYAHRFINSKSDNKAKKLLKSCVLLIGLFNISYILLLPLLTDSIMAMSEVIRVLSTFIMIAPVAFFMGVPFPLGLSMLQRTDPHLVPWAWAINGCASVLSAVLAVILAIEIGFSGVIILAVVLYIIAWSSNVVSTRPLE